MQISLLVAGATLCAVAGVGLFVDHLREQQGQMDQVRAEAELSEAETLSRTPSSAVRGLHNLIGHGGWSSACSMMTADAQRQFAAVHAQPTCEAAARFLGDQVTEHGRYVLFRYPEDAEVIRGDQGTMDGCAVTWRDVFDSPDRPDPGPRLGRFTMIRLLGLGFKITGVAPCPPAGGDEQGTASSSSAATSSPSIPSTATRAPVPSTSRAPLGLLPSYGPAIPGILANHISKGDAAGVCDLFTDAGRTQFAAAHQAADCPAAVASINAKVTDHELYADPHGATEAPNAGGRVVVDGCHLTWSSWSGTSRPGPQVGRLELEHPPGQMGYLIVGYRSC
ncbi:hypothetical protein GCM10029964_060460 [Kibdelosporangium lantanae]